jgi:tRNA nucleotidyltransferase (CCA-adding enzyme)
VPNLASILERQLEPGSLRLLRRMAEVCRERADGISLVGGVVRDVLLGLSTNDLDISVAGLDERLALDMANSIGGRLAGPSQFNTFKIEVGSTVIDVAMTRQESYSHPGALPEVRPGSVDQDLARRDFTVNAMAIDLSADNWGELLDPMGGQADLEWGFIRVLHRESFTDDATRIFRAVRYAQRLDFTLENSTAGENSTASLLEDNLPQLNSISGDRIRHEFQRVFEETDTGRLLQMLNRLGVLEAVFGPLGRRPDSWPDAIDPAEQPEQPEHLVWLAYLATGLTPGEASEFARRLNMDSLWSRVVQDVAGIEAILGDLSSDASRSQIYRLLEGFRPAALLGVSASHRNSASSRNIDLYLSELRSVRIELNGRDLIALGVEEGPAIGTLLAALLEARLDGRVSGRQDEEELVKHLVNRR